MDLTFPRSRTSTTPTSLRSSPSYSARKIGRNPIRISKEESQLFAAKDRETDWKEETRGREMKFVSRKEGRKKKKKKMRKNRHSALREPSVYRPWPKVKPSSSSASGRTSLASENGRNGGETRGGPSRASRSRDADSFHHLSASLLSSCSRDELRVRWNSCTLWLCCSWWCFRHLIRRFWNQTFT